MTVLYVTCSQYVGQPIVLRDDVEHDPGGERLPNKNARITGNNPEVQKLVSVTHPVDISSVVETEIVWKHHVVAHRCHIDLAPTRYKENQIVRLVYGLHRASHLRGERAIRTRYCSVEVEGKKTSHGRSPLEIHAGTRRRDQLPAAEQMDVGKSLAVH